MLFGLGLGALAYSLVVEFPPDISPRLAAFLMIIAAFSFLFAGFFPVDPGDAAETFTGQVHAWSLRSGVVIMLLAGLLAGNRLRQRGGVSGWLPLALSVAALATNWGYRQAPLGENGLEQRALFGVLVGWVVVTALACRDD